MADLRRLVIEQLCAATGGPCTYTGRSMEEAHSGLNLTDADFDAFVDDLVRAMDSREGADGSAEAAARPARADAAAGRSGQCRHIVRHVSFAEDDAG